mmetsp:Transcript_60007/g.170657  ORF Transcript_60007/g.170657 Transcript_60007/m.170657 type:complete len:219 (+) Transcript_60007:603-1259(+)
MKSLVAVVEVYHSAGPGRGHARTEPHGQEDRIGVRLHAPVVPPKVAQLNDLGPHAVEDLRVQRSVVLSTEVALQGALHNLRHDLHGWARGQDNGRVADDTPHAALKDADTLRQLSPDQRHFVAPWQHQGEAVERGSHTLDGVRCDDGGASRVDRIDLRARLGLDFRAGLRLGLRAGRRLLQRGHVRRTGLRPRVRDVRNTDEARAEPLVVERAALPAL